MDAEPLERWAHWRGGDTAVVWDAHLGGSPVCLLGVESRPSRRGFVPADGPQYWCSGTLFPQSSKKLARAINAASGNRPLVVLANLSGFDGSPESMRRLQLEYGAEIGRAVTNFRRPHRVLVVSRYHGGAFVVFSKGSTSGSRSPRLRAPTPRSSAARRPRRRCSPVRSPPAPTRTRASANSGNGSARAGRRRPPTGCARGWPRPHPVRSEKLGEVADEFDAGPHRPARARGRFGGPDHSGARAAPLPHRRGAAGHGAATSDRCHGRGARLTAYPSAAGRATSGGVARG